LKWRNSWSHLE